MLRALLLRPAIHRRALSTPRRILHAFYKNNFSSTTTYRTDETPREEPSVKASTMDAVVDGENGDDDLDLDDEYDDDWDLEDESDDDDLEIPEPDTSAWDDLLGPEFEEQQEEPDLENAMEEFQNDDSTSVGHLLLMQRRQVLKYLRLIEMEVPHLAEFRKPFTPPTSQTPIIVRHMSYGGEKHPADRKASIVIPVSELGLNGPKAIHKFKLLAGVRWSDHPPRDAGLGSHEISTRKHGYFKISHEAFPELQMNLKWCSDVLDSLRTRANLRDPKETYDDVPLDIRHLESQARKRRLGDHRSGPGAPKRRPTIKDFPNEWLLNPKEAKRVFADPRVKAARQTSLLAYHE